MIDSIAVVLPNFLAHNQIIMEDITTHRVSIYGLSQSQIPRRINEEEGI